MTSIKDRSRALLDTAFFRSCFLCVSLIAVLNLLDCYITLTGVSIFGTAYEANPLMRILISQNIGLFIFVKTFGSIVLFPAFLRFVSTENPILRKTTVGVLLLVLSVYLYVVLKHVPWFFS